MTRWNSAVRHLKSADPLLARLIARIGPCRLSPKSENVFEALLKAIIHQQLNGKAAATIHGRVREAIGPKMTPERLLKMPDAPLRAAGLSANKLLALRDLATKCASGAIPPLENLRPLADADIVASLTAVRGVGEWTAQMFLMFNLGRPDVLPSADFGVRRAFGLLYRKNGRLPPPSALEKQGRRWAPHRTAASWYLWRSLDD